MIMALMCMIVVPSEEQYDHGIHVCHIANLRNSMIMACMCVSLLIRGTV